MRKRHSYFLTAMALILTLVLSFSVVHVSLISYAEETPSKAAAEEQPDTPEPTNPKPTDPPSDNPPATQPSTNSQVPIEPTAAKPTESTTKSGLTLPNLFSSTTSTAPSTSDTKPDTSEKDTTPVSEKEKPSETEPGTTKSDSTSTTKSAGGNKTTTKKNTNYTTRYTPAAPAQTYTKMSIPHVDNTEVSGSTLSPMEAYFERISGDTTTEPFSIIAEETELATTETPVRNLSTTAIVAICLVAIGVVVCLLTLLFAMRNKRAAGDRAVEYDDEYEDADVGDSAQTNDGYYDNGGDLNSATQVDETSQFTVVSLDDKDYKD